PRAREPHPTAVASPLCGAPRSERAWLLRTLRLAYPLARARYARQRNQAEGRIMAFQVGDRVVAESESTQRAPRTGTVREVLRGDPSPRYRIEWDDGNTTSLTPSAGVLHVVSKRDRLVA